MTNTNDVREVHKLLDSLFDNSELSHKQIDLIRDLVPELPKQKTLEEITEHVYDAWVGTNGNEWPDDMYVELETWLLELHAQLQGLAPAEPAHPEIAPAEPAHPEFLETEADYENAPDGTIVAKDGKGTVWIKRDVNKWFCGSEARNDYQITLGGHRRVLRLGWGK